MGVCIGLQTFTRYSQSIYRSRCSPSDSCSPLSQPFAQIGKQDAIARASPELETIRPVSPGRLTAKWTVARRSRGPLGSSDRDPCRMSCHAGSVAPCTQNNEGAGMTQCHGYNALEQSTKRRPECRAPGLALSCSDADFKNQEGRIP